MMDLSSGLMGATGLGVFIYIKDMFSSQAVKIGAQASILEGRMAKSAAGIRGSMTMMGGGLAVAGIGIAALKLGDMIARQAEGIDEKVRELRIKGFPAEEAAKVKAQVRGLASEIGIIPQEAMTASVWAAEYGLRRAEDITAALRTTFRAAVGTGTEAVATSEGLLRTMAGFGYGPSSLPMISGKMQIGADEMRISFGELTSVFPEAISLSRLYGLSLDDMLVNLVAAKYGGMDAGRALAGMRMSFMMLEAPQGKMAERLAAIRNGEVMAAIQAGHMGDALRMLSEEMAGLGASERAGFLKSLGVGGRQATVLNALIENAPKVKGLYAELGGWAEREQRSFEEMNASYGHQLAIRSVRLKNIGITLGEAVKKSNAPFLETQNKLLLGIDNFIRGNEKAVVAIMAPTRTLGRLAVVAGLSTAGIGLLRFGLIKAGVSAVQGAGMFSTLGIGIKAALTSMLPVALTIAGIALAVKGVEWAYRSNLGGFGDWVNKTISGTAKVATAVAFALSKENIVKKNGKFFAGIPEDLAKELEKAGLYDVANTWIGRAWDVKSLGVGLTQGFKSIFAEGSVFNEELKKEMQLMGGNWASLFGGAGAGDMSTWYGAGKGLGAGFGAAIATLVLVIVKSTNATLLLANTIRETFSWMGTPGTLGNKYGTEPAKGIGRGIGKVASTANWLGWGLTSDVLGQLRTFFPQGKYINEWADYAESEYQKGLTPSPAAVATAESAASRIEQSNKLDRIHDAIRAQKTSQPIQVHSEHKIGRTAFLDIITDHLVDEARATA